MSSARPYLPWAVGAVAVLGAASVGVQRAYLAPARELRSQIDGVTSRVRQLEQERDTLRAVKRTTGLLGARTLGAKLDVVQHRLRTGLAAIAEGQALTGIAADCGQPQETANPLVNVRGSGVPGSLKRDLRASPGFQVVRGSLKATGPLAGVLATLAGVQSQPWVHRVEAYSIKPLGKERKAYELRVEVATLFAPGWVGTSDTEPAIAAPSAGVESAWRAVAARDPFVMPALPVAVGPGPKTADAPATLAPKPYDEWRLTGVMSGSRGLEAIFRNVRTGAGRTTLAGEEFLGVKVIGEGPGGKSGLGGIIIELDGARFELSNGDTIAARRPVGS